MEREKDIVLIHGWCCDHRGMKPLVDLLSSRYRVTLLDLPGCGQSDWNSSIENIHDMADLLLPHLPKNAIYIGWSFGGLISISIASRHPEYVNRFIGIGTTPKFVEADGWHGIAKPGFISYFAKIEQVGQERFFKDFCDNEYSEISPKPASYDELKDIYASSNITLKTLLKGIQICDQTDLRKEFQNLSIPLDFLIGENDEAIPKAAFLDIQKLNTRAKVHPILKAHHVPHWAYPAEVNAILNQLLAKEAHTN